MRAKFGVSLPNNWGIEDPNDLVGIAVLAEQLGYDSVWTSDHVLNVGYVDERIGNKPYYHGLCTLAYVAAKTTRISIGTSIVVLPYRNPLELAKFTATLDQLSGGRLILGVGVGGLAEEFAAMGIPFEERGSISDEALSIMKALWTQDEASYEGKRWKFSKVKFSPKPLQRPHLPIWVGGTAPPALRRAAKFGDGWHPTGISPEEFRAGCEYVRSVAAAENRDASRFDMCMRLVISMDGILTTEIERRSVLPGDDPAGTVARLQAYVDAGATHFILAINCEEVEALRDMMTRVARDVIAHFRDS